MNGKQGDSAWSDMLCHGLHSYPEDIEKLIREILALDSSYFGNITRSTLEEYEAWQTRIRDWERGENFDEGRVALRNALAKLRQPNA